MEGTTPGLYRELCDIANAVCITKEYRLGIAHLVKHIQLPDAQITNSSSWDELHSAERARIDNYYDYACSWAVAWDDPEKWLQFDLLQEYVALGVLLRDRCDQDNHASLIELAFSSDGSNWVYTSTEPIAPEYTATMSYPNHLSYTHWFSNPITARYWRLYILEYVGAPSAKMDIIGQVP